MSLQDVLLLKRLNVGILSSTGVAVLLLGAWIGFSAFSTVPDVDDLQVTARGPASISGVEPKSFSVDKPEGKVETLTLECVHDGSQIKINSVAKQVRLKTRLCGRGQPALDGSTIINRANGFAATLFKLENGAFSTDYMTLIDGQNQFIFTIEDAKGVRTVAELTILRSRGL